MSKEATAAPASGGEAFDPLDPELRRDPYPVYATMRRQSPLVWLGEEDGQAVWAVFRYGDCRRVLRDPSMVMSPPTGVVPTLLQGGAAADVLPNLLIFNDGERHGRMRRLVVKAFTPRAISKLETRIEQIVEELLDDVAANGEMDVMSEFAFQVPVLVICEMLGIPAEDRQFFKRSTGDFSRIFETTWSTEEQITACHEATAALCEYFEEHVARRRAAPGDEILDHLISAEEDGDRLTHQELIAMSVQLLNAGYETTMGLIGNGLLAVLRHPDQRRLVASDSALLAPAVEECLRWDSPIQYTGRVAGQPFKLHGQNIEAGDVLLTVIGSANRDAELGDDAEVFDVGREPLDHLSFGSGTHFCLGAHLARLESRIALGGVLRRFPEMRLAEQELRYRDSFLFRTLESLRVEFESPATV